MDSEIKKPFKTPKTLFQQRINDIIKDEDSLKLFEDLIELHLFKNAEKNQTMIGLVEIYNLLGLEKFMDLIALMENKTIKFPSLESFQETIEVALCFYLKQYKDKDWKEIKDIVQDEDFASIKVGIKIQQLQKFIDFANERQLFKYKKVLEKLEKDKS
jgi:hypothetical protein